MPSDDSASLGSWGRLPSVGLRWWVPIALGWSLFALAPQSLLAQDEITDLGRQCEKATLLPARLTACRAWVDSEPKNVAAHHALGEALEAAGDQSGALAAFRQALALEPSRHHHRDVGAALLHLNQPDSALVHLDLAVQGDSVEAAAHSDRGVALAMLGRRKEAGDSWRAALKVAPDDVEALFNLAQLTLEDGPRGELAPLLDRLRALVPNEPGTIHRLAGLYRDGGLPEPALELFRKVQTLAPTHPQGFMSEALLLMRLERFEESLRPMQRAIALRPDFANVWGGLGLACYKLGRHQEAVAYWERAKLLRPSFLTENPAYQPMYQESLSKAGPQPAARLPSGS